MAIFRRKDKEILDLTEKYRRDQARASEITEVSTSPTTDSSSAFGFLGNMAAASSPTETPDETVDISSSADVRKRQLSKRLLDMTEKIEDLSNQIYHLQQRIEVLERKAGVGGY